MQPSGRNALAYARALGVDVATLYDAADPDDPELPIDREHDLLSELHVALGKVLAMGVK